MKIGIMTFWWSEDNYGQLLQCYALQKYLRDKGHDAFLIRYYRETDYIKSRLRIFKVFNPVKLYMYLHSRIKKVLTKIEQKKKSRNFSNFRNEHIISTEKIYKSYYELLKDPPEADAYIVGSDQVWNMSYKQDNIINAFFLNFGGEEIKRMSYAASFGKDELEEELIPKITPLLAKFSFVSVREKTGVDLCKKMGLLNTEWSPDPTMLLDVSVYRDLYKNANIKDKLGKEYVFVYLLNNKTKFSMNKLYKWAKSKNLDIVYITGNSKFDRFKKLYLTIHEWLYYLDNAAYVVTNSFHCCVFSLLFQKKVIPILLSGKDKKMNSRIHDLFDSLEVDSYFNDYSFTDFCIEPNWKGINENIDLIKKRSVLIDVLEINNGN